MSTSAVLEKPRSAAAPAVPTQRPAAARPAAGPESRDRCPECWEPVHEGFCDHCGKELIREVRDDALDRIGPPLDRGA